MCGRFAISSTIDELIVEFVAQGGDFRDWKPAYSVAPTDAAPIVRERHHGDSDAPTRFVEIAKLGFRPGWAKPRSPAPINARLETAATGGMFSGAFTSQRCLVPMTGYYEWEGTATGKQPPLTLRSHTVDRRVNSVRTVDPQDRTLIDPVVA